MSRRDAAGFIFLANNSTEREVMRRRLFAAPRGQLGHVLSIRDGAVLFLYNTETRVFRGIFRASGRCGENLERDAFGGGKFPAQLRFRVDADCAPLSLADATPWLSWKNNKFEFVLSTAQTRELCGLMRCSAPPPASAARIVKLAPALQRRGDSSSPRGEAPRPPSRHGDARRAALARPLEAAASRPQRHHAEADAASARAATPPAGKARAAKRARVEAAPAAAAPVVASPAKAASLPTRSPLPPAPVVSGDERFFIPLLEDDDDATSGALAEAPGGADDAAGGAAREEGELSSGSEGGAAGGAAPGAAVAHQPPPPPCAVLSLHVTSMLPMRLLVGAPPLDTPAGASTIVRRAQALASSDPPPAAAATAGSAAGAAANEGHRAAMLADALGPAMEEAARVAALPRGGAARAAARRRLLAKYHPSQGGRGLGNTALQWLFEEITKALVEKLAEG